MVAKDIISRDTLKRLTTDLARQLLGLEGEAVELLETQNQRIEVPTRWCWRCSATSATARRSRWSATSSGG
jgi:hypothetical protein